MYHTVEPNGIMEKAIAFNPTFTLQAHRNKSFDGRLGCGAGWLITLSDKNTKLVIKYNQSIAKKEEAPTAEEILGSLCTDAYCVIYNSYNEFCEELGLTQNAQSKNIYKECQRIKNNMLRMFTQDQLDILYEWLHNEGY